MKTPENPNNHQASENLKIPSETYTGHYHDPKRPYMSMHDRAAQFAPYKSLGDLDEYYTDDYSNSSQP